MNRQPSRSPVPPKGRRATLVVLAVVMTATVMAVGPAAPVAFAQDETSKDTAKIAKLNKQALESYDNLNFDQAKTLLEQAITLLESAGLTGDPTAARTHLNLGMVLMGGFQQRDAAADHFKTALKIQPDLTPPRGLFNPEVQAIFDETRTAVKAEAQPKAAATAPEADTEGEAEDEGAVAARPKPGLKPKAKAKPGRTGEGEDEEEDGEGAPAGARAGSVLLALAVGSGAGVTKGRFDVDGFNPATASGTLSPSRLAHATVGGGYFISEELLLSLEGRLQLVTGTTPLCEAGGSNCVSPPGFAAAVLAKATYFLGSGPLQPFVTGGLGGGRIRQVLNLGRLEDPMAPAPPAPASCGADLMQACVTTVSGGPLWLVGGGGVSYDLGSFMLLGAVAANIGVPTFMLNLDVTIGMGVRL